MRNPEPNSLELGMSFEDVTKKIVDGPLAKSKVKLDDPLLEYWCYDFGSDGSWWAILGFDEDNVLRKKGSICVR